MRKLFMPKEMSRHQAITLTLLFYTHIEAENLCPNTQI